MTAPAVRSADTSVTYEQAIERLRALARDTDRARLALGFAAAYWQTQGVSLRDMAAEIGLSKSALAEYIIVARFVAYATPGIDEDDPFPGVIGYSHVRAALRHYGADYDAAADALAHCESEALTVDQFAHWLSQQADAPALVRVSLPAGIARAAYAAVRLAVGLVPAQYRAALETLAEALEARLLAE